MPARGAPWRALLATALVALAAAPAASAAVGQSLTDPTDQWFPSPDGASWTWEWSDNTYAPTPTKELYTLDSRSGADFVLAWTTDGQGNGDGTVASAGKIEFQRTLAGLLNLGWAGTPPPPQVPILCSAASQCANTLAGSLYQLIWGSRAPTLAEPLLRGARWSSAGGAANDVVSDNRYLGTEKVVVTAFPNGVVAAKVQSDITQAGAIGDPYGSGVRTVWWVRGVGPVKIAFQHTGGELEQAQLDATGLTPVAVPGDADYLPFVTGRKLTYRWRNDRHMPKWSIQEASVSQVVNNTARLDVKSVKGPIKLVGAYLFSTRLDGVTNLAGSTKSVTLSKFPKLGPASQPQAKRPRLLTPLDFLAYGFNPVIPAYPATGQSWTSDVNGRDFHVYGVTGNTKVTGTGTVTVPAGKFTALQVTSVLSQKGFPYGTGTRTSWFAAGRGLVKLTFRHQDGSTSTVELVK